VVAAEKVFPLAVGDAGRLRRSQADFNPPVRGRRAPGVAEDFDYLSGGPQTLVLRRFQVGRHVLRLAGFEVVDDVAGRLHVPVGDAVDDGRAQLARGHPAVAARRFGYQRG